MGKVRVRGVHTLQRTDVDPWGKWCVGTEDHVHGCFQGTLSGGRDL